MNKYINQLIVRTKLRSLRKDERGQDLIEYALIIGFMVIAIYIVLPNNLMPTLNSIFSKIVVILGQSAAS